MTKRRQWSEKNEKLGKCLSAGNQAVKSESCHQLICSFPPYNATTIYMTLPEFRYFSCYDNRGLLLV